MFFIGGGGSGSVPVFQWFSETIPRNNLREKWERED
jgi:hypothetical protein